MILALRFFKKSAFMPFSTFGRGRLKPAASRRLPQVKRPALTHKKLVSPYTNYLPVDDRRLFHPLGNDRPLKTTSGGRVAVQARPRPSENLKNTVPSALGFVNPARVLICVRRNRRKQVLHAKGIAGGTGFKPPKFNWTSNYSC